MLWASTVGLLHRLTGRSRTSDRLTISRVRDSATVRRRLLRHGLCFAPFPLDPPAFDELELSGKKKKKKMAQIRKLVWEHPPVGTLLTRRARAPSPCRRAALAATRPPATNPPPTRPPARGARRGAMSEGDVEQQVRPWLVDHNLRPRPAPAPLQGSTTPRGTSAGESRWRGHFEGERSGRIAAQRACSAAALPHLQRCTWPPAFWLRCALC